MRELVAENIIFIGTGLFIALSGIIIQKFKLYFLIAGYNTATPSEKKRIIIERVAIAMRNTFLVIGFLWVSIPIILELLGILQIYSALILIMTTIGGIIWLVRTLNTNEKFKRK